MLLSLTLVSKSKMPRETSLDLTSSVKTSVDAKVKGLVFNVDYKRIMAEKDVCQAHMFHFQDCNLSFYTKYLHL